MEVTEAPVYFYDEMRYGTRTVLGRAWTVRGKRPSGRMQIAYHYGYLYLALNPRSGDVFALLLPGMDSQWYQVFLREFSRDVAARGVIGDGTAPLRLITDNAGSHHATSLEVPDSIISEYLPAYSPELNPCERFFEEVRRAMKNTVYESIEAIEDALTAILQTYWDNPGAVIQLTYWDWMKPTSECATS